MPGSHPVPLLANADSGSAPADTPDLDLLHGAPVGLALVRDGIVVRCNRTLAGMLGYHPDELQGLPLRLWYPREDDLHSGAARARRTALIAGEGFHCEALLHCRDGATLRCDVRARPVQPPPIREWVLAAAETVGDRRPHGGLLEVHTELERLVAIRTHELQSTVAELHDKLAQHEVDEHRVHRLAHFDPLTNLPNRTLLSQSADEAIAAARMERRPLAVMFLDLDRFKNVNDSLGHRIGDELLVALAARLSAAIRERDTLSRLGGDEFMLLLPDTDPQGAAHVAQKLIARTLPPFLIGMHELTVTPSIGIAMYPIDGEDFDTLSQCADAAMYRAKRDGRNNFRFFTHEMQVDAARALLLENALRRALEREQLQLHYQPLVDLKSGHVVGAEALLRWRHPDFGLVSPVEFIPVAEASGLVGEIGEWVLRTAMHQLKTWTDAGLPPITMAVNLSAMQFRHIHLPDLVSQILHSTGVPPDRLELELTEGAAMEDPKRAVAITEDLHQRGVRLCIDDFGTGYSSLSYLKRFRVYKLKIDQSFVRDISDDPEDKAIVSAIIHMARSLGLQTIAEGVETEAQLAFLRQQGCDEAQGYLFSRPLAPAHFEAFMRDLQLHR